MARVWTKEEIQILKDNYSNMGAKELESLLPARTYAAIRSKAASYNITKKISSNNVIAGSSVWTEEELALLREVYPIKEIEEYLPLFPNRTYASIRTKALRLGIKRLKGFWSNLEDNILIENYSISTRSQLEQLLPNRTWQSITTRASEFNLNKPHDDEWTKEELDTLKEVYPIKEWEDIFLALPNRNYAGINMKASRLGLKREAYLWTKEELDTLKAVYPIKEWEDIFLALPNRNYAGINMKASRLKIKRLISGVSIKEKEIVDYIKSIYTGWIIENDRLILEGQELDIVLPDLGIAIEFNGNYWHSEYQKPDKNYHLNKLLKVEEFGYRLISISETDWNTKQDIVKSRLNHFIQGSKKIYARNCKIKEVDIVAARVFLDTNHIQGYANGNIRYGLYYNEELIGLMTFIKSRFNKNIEYELVRYCSKLGVGIIGGASKLLKCFEETIKPKSLVSYADRNYSSGGVYKQLGFTLSHASEPNYKYHGKDKIYSRQQCMKHKLPKLFPQFYKPEMTEKEIMSAARFFPVYDCGNLVFIKNYR